MAMNAVGKYHNLYEQSIPLECVKCPESQGEVANLFSVFDMGARAEIMRTNDHQFDIRSTILNYLVRNFCRTYPNFV